VFSPKSGAITLVSTTLKHRVTDIAARKPNPFKIGWLEW